MPTCVIESMVEDGWMDVSCDDVGNKWKLVMNAVVSCWELRGALRISISASYL
jgi:hypothetical protein